MSSSFEGITNQYRKTDEYKSFVNSIKNDYPDMPLYLVEMAISTHKTDPQFYKTATKLERQKMAKAAVEIDASRAQGAKQQPQALWADAVKVYKDASELPPTTLAPGLESLEVSA